MVIVKVTLRIKMTNYYVNVETYVMAALINIGKNG